MQYCTKPGLCPTYAPAPLAPLSHPPDCRRRRSRIPTAGMTAATLTGRSIRITPSRYPSTYLRDGSWRCVRMCLIRTECPPSDGSVARRCHSMGTNADVKVPLWRDLRRVSAERRQHERTGDPHNRHGSLSPHYAIRTEYTPWAVKVRSDRMYDQPDPRYRFHEDRPARRQKCVAAPHSKRKRATRVIRRQTHPLAPRTRDSPNTYDKN